MVCGDRESGLQCSIENSRHSQFCRQPRVVLRGIVGLAAALRLRTVAEGVETWEHAFFLRAAGVDYGQGFSLGRPVPLERVLGELVAANIALPLPATQAV